MGSITDEMSNLLVASDAIVKRGISLRKAAKEFGVTKSVLHKFIHDQLVFYSQPLQRQCVAVLKINKEKCNDFSRFPRVVYCKDGKYMYYDNKGEKKQRIW